MPILQSGLAFFVTLIPAALFIPGSALKVRPPELRLRRSRSLQPPHRPPSLREAMRNPQRLPAPHKRPESRRRHTAERRSAQLPGNSVRPFPRINRNSRCRHTNQQRQQNRPSHHRYPFRFRQPPKMRGKFLWPFTLFYEKIPRFVRRFFRKRNPAQRTRKRAALETKGSPASLRHGSSKSHIKYHHHQKSRHHSKGSRWECSPKCASGSAPPPRHTSWRPPQKQAARA